MKNENNKKVDDFSDIKKLAEEADKNQGFELGFEDDFVVDITQLDFIDDKQNPKESYRLFYTIESILKGHLPKGDKYKELRKVVREEKTIFLTGKRKDERGIRGADSRQAYVSSHLKVALNSLFDWINEGGNSFDLFLKFRQLNIQYGYFTKEELSDFDQKMKTKVFKISKEDNK